jgi:site-specific DNA recombinase
VSIRNCFAGAQFALTFPLFVHCGVELWVPEIGGRIDPDSEAHDLVMSLFGGLSKAERARIQRRVKAAMTTMARAGGRYLGGRPPYGYRLAPISAHPNAEKARVGATLNRLEPDPVTAPVVQRIFAERLAGNGYSSIARGLNHEAVPSPAATDRERNSHRDPRGWAASAVRAILTNARYTGHEVWNRQRRDYELLDVNTPADGHVRRMRSNAPDQWIWSPEPTHEALVDRHDWQRVQAMTTTQVRAARSSDVTYLLHGRVFCAACGRRMTGQRQARRRCYYRCELRRARPGFVFVDHPPDVYVREDARVQALDAWLEELFAPERAQETARLVVAADANPDYDAAAQDARERLQSARQRLAQYRRALDGGADPATVTQWITEAAELERAAASDLQAATATAPPRLTVDDVLATIEELGSLAGVLSTAEPNDRAQLYEALGVATTYDAKARTAVLEVALPRSANNVSEGGLVSLRDAIRLTRAVSLAAPG